METLPEIVEVTPLGGYRLRLKFKDGVSGEIDFGPLLTFRGVFEPLREAALFSQVRVNPDTGTIEWPTGADQDPLVLYCRVTGQPLPKDFQESA
jgi:hypothetical protein